MNVSAFLRRAKVALFVAFFSPIAIAPAFAQTAQPVSTGTGAITGTVIDATSGAAISGAVVFLGNGPHSYTAQTDVRGAFSFPAVAPGLYSLLVAKNGYGAQRVVDYPVLAATNYSLNVTLRAVSLSSLQTIATVTSNASNRGTFNTTPAAVSQVSSQVFAQQGQQQVMQVLDQVPGFYTAHESANNNPAAPGAASYPNIRGAQTYETATTIDGHAVARVGGGYRTQYLNPALFQDVEVIKGPGAMSPTIDYAIAGTVNFLTLDPTVERQASATYGVDSWGSQIFAFRATGSLGATHRFEYALVYAGNGQNGWEQGFQTAYPIGQWVNIGTAGAHTSNGGAPSGSFAYVDNAVSPVTMPTPNATNHALNLNNPGYANQNNYGQTGLFACCAYVSTFNNENAELIKFRYHFSDATSLTYTFMGTHGTTDENGNHLWQADTYFNPTLNMTSGTAAQIAAVSSAHYPIAPGQQFVYDDNYLPPEQLRHQDEPINQIDLRTRIGKNITLLARGYTAVTVNNAYDGVTSPTSTVTTYAQVFGAFVPCYGGAGLSGLNAAYPGYSATCSGSGAAAKANPIIYTGQYEPITYGPGPQQAPYCLNPAFNPSNPSQNGYYLSPIGTGNGVVNGVQTGVAKGTCTSSTPGYVGLKQNGISGCNNYTGPPNCAYFASNEHDAVVGGTLEGFFTAGSNVYTLAYDSNVTNVSQFYYLNMPDIMPVPPGDRQNFSTLMARGNFQLNPKLSLLASVYQSNYRFHISRDNGFTFQDTSSAHFDARAGITYIPTDRVSLRFSAGSSIAPPYIFGILSSGSHIPGAPPSTTFNNFGSSSFYTQGVAAPNIAPETGFGYDIGGDFRVFDRYTVISTDLYLENIFNQYLISANGGAFLLDGTYDDGKNGTWPLYLNGPINIARAQLSGWEFAINRAPQRGLGYHASIALQRSFPFNIPCYVYGLPVSTHGCNNPAGNLAEVPLINFQVPGAGTGVGTAQNNVGGTARNSIPYSQGYGELDYYFPNSVIAWIGSQYYGHNNTYNEPAFVVASAGVQLPVLNSKNTYVNVSAYNLFNQYPNGWVTQSQGSPISTINSLQGFTNALAIGPIRVEVQVTTHF